MARRVELIPDGDHELIIERVCAVDVGKSFGMVCTRLPGPDPRGRRVSRVWRVEATTNAVIELAEQLVAERVQKVTIESTSDYWRIWFYLLEAYGLDVQLVNAREVRNVPGRPKTDTHDCVWQAKLTERGLLRPSLVPPAEVRRLRDYTRMRTDLTRERTRHWQRMEKLLEDALVKVSAVASAIDLQSVRDMIEAMIAGQRDPHVLAGMARGRLKAKHSALVQALTGRFDDHHGELARMLLEQIDALSRHIDQLTDRITHLLAQLPTTPAAQPDPGTGDPPDPHDPTGAADPADPADPAGAAGAAGADEQGTPSPEKRLQEIPGISQISAQAIIAEIGLDMSRFPTAAHLTAWARLTPTTAQSGTKTKKGKTGKGNPYLKGALGVAAAAAARTNTFLGERYRRIVKRRGKGKALVATARSILVIIWHLLSDPNARFNDLGADWHTSRLDRHKRVRNHIHQLQALGYTVTLNPIG